MEVLSNKGWEDISIPLFCDGYGTSAAEKSEMENDTGSSGR